MDFSADSFATKTMQPQMDALHPHDTYEDPAANAKTASGGSSATSPSHVGFETSPFFRFHGGASDFFGRMNYDEDLSASTAPSSSGASGGGNNDILPPHAISPSNQAAHDHHHAPLPPSTSSGYHHAPMPPMAPQSQDSQQQRQQQQLQDAKAAAARSVHSLPSRRKSSIEMFLSQSPSQALGGDFLKIALDDRQMSLQADQRGDPAAAAYSSGQFSLNGMLDPSSPSAKKYGRQARYGTSTAAATLVRSSSAGNNYAYPLSPRLSGAADDAWNENASARSTPNGFYHEQSQQEYYGSASNNHHYASSSSRDAFPPRHDSAGPSSSSSSGSSGGGGGLYRSNSTSRMVNPPSSYGYSHSRSPNGQWSASHHQPQQVSNAYAASGNGMFINGLAHPQQMASPQQQHLQYQSPPMGVRGGNGMPRSSNRPMSMYAPRMTPPLPESSPPHSPRRSPMGMMNMGGMVKQCKFFLQGHCRMGSKCKFAHQASSMHMAPPPMGPSSMSSNAALYQQQQIQMSPPQRGLSPHHHHALLQDDLQHPMVPSFARAPARTSSYSRSNELGGGGNGPMSGGTAASSSSSGVSAPLLGGASLPPGDAAGLSTSLSVEDIQGRVFAMSKDQNGCRLLQEQLDYEDRSDLCEVIYHESLDHLAEMMVDPFGNYLFQKLLERVNDSQRLVIIRRVSSNLVAAALNLHGTRSVQKVVEVCATSPVVVEEEPMTGEDEDSLSSETTQTSSERRRRVTNLPDLIVEALKDDAVRLCIDSNGNHVIQRALQFMKPEYNQFVFDAVCKECTTVGTHRHGCCVLQRCLDAANKQQKSDVIAQVEHQAMKLMQDPYGNYVVQYVLDSCTAEEAYGVIVKPLGHIYELSIQKFSSNVIEKCLEKAPERVRQSYIKEITNCPKMNKMLQDQFANYVVQRALCVCSEEQCLLLVKAIRPHLASMKNTSGGRRITARILKRFPKMDVSLDIALSPTGGHGAGGLFDNPATAAGNHLVLGPGQEYGHHAQTYAPMHHHQQAHLYGGHPHQMQVPNGNHGHHHGHGLVPSLSVMSDPVMNSSGLGMNTTRA